MKCDTCMKLYNITGCNFTDDMNAYSVSDAVIIFHWDVYISKEQLPQGDRPLHQMWVWFNMESPSNTGGLEHLNNVFNLTMCYRKDSDIFVPYGSLQMTKDLQNYSIPKENKLVVWTVSNWLPHFRRVQYYNELRKYINIDIYGKNHRPLDKASLHTTISQYKFYLAFENSVHTDYITEKLWRNAFLSGTVPVVLGPSRENYEKFIPPDSFIHVEDFNTAEQLAKYLEKLDKDDKEYMKYFSWQKHFVSKSYETVDHYCKACIELKKMTEFRKMTNLIKWYRS
ncbi:4-galactosyl-N-acetylglucosaminide 3-alpha-L-fucosyltransferase FUT5-like [Protopterus annectens]|uniref:4-galactosyl-N-acetylglucosaminide 3-alpha-L-fucosyltransferase FUT5-like n=1 Tax=Protopterus annectens TaxID=7888 RepID=UPI001CF9FDD8|nr:4-galactosyl-N-acetylglucosaminide 3-alpha-L-fucosyltransferase FUT5-like [Protopterus annectens]